MTNNSYIRKSVIDILHSSNVKFNENKIFFNSDSIRLSWYGNKVLSEEFEHHVFLCNMNTLPSKLFEGFAKLTMPYYVGDKSITIYSNYDAFGIRIYDSIEDYLKALIKY